METLKTINITALLIIGIIGLIAFWYVTIALVILFITYNVSKIYITGKRIVNE